MPFNDSTPHTHVTRALHWTHMCTLYVRSACASTTSKKCSIFILSIPINVKYSTAPISHNQPLHDVVSSSCKCVDFHVNLMGRNSMDSLIESNSRNIKSIYEPVSVGGFVNSSSCSNRKKKEKIERERGRETWMKKTVQSKRELTIESNTISATLHLYQFGNRQIWISS